MKAIIFDTETTGLIEPEVIEMAWIEVEDYHLDTPVRSASFRFNPSKPIELGALATHNILPSELEGFAASNTAIKELPSDLTYLIGHNIDYDWGVMGKPAVKRICTQALSRAVWPDLDSHRQIALYYHIMGATDETRQTLRDAHSALADVKVCHRLLKEICHKLQITSLEALWKASEAARIPTKMTFGKHKGKLISQVDKGWVKWYRQQPDTDPYLLLAFSKAGL